MFKNLVINDEYVSKQSSINMDDCKYILTVSGKDKNRRIKEKNNSIKPFNNRETAGEPLQWR